MSLLLDARKKSQQAQTSPGGENGHSGLELSLEELPASASPAGTASSKTDHDRLASHNLFSAKTQPTARASVSRNLLIALGGMFLLFSAGAGYVWYATQPTQSAAIMIPVKPNVAATPPQNNLVPEIAPPPAVSPAPKVSHLPVRKPRPAIKTTKTSTNNPSMIEQHQDRPIDPLLNDAYLAYRNGKFDQARQLYGQVNNLDERNSDALLGLAVIAQRSGEDSNAAHYYSKVLEIDPRNAVANAGMSALSANANRETRLKILLNEQQDSPALYFALGNRYAEQSRWAEAQQAYSNAYKLEPDNAELAFNLATSLDRLGQYKSSVQYYRRAIELDPKHLAGFDHKQISQRIDDLTH